MWPFDKKPEKLKAATALILPVGATASWMEHDFENFAREAYLKNVVSYRCINEIARAVSSVEWNVYRKEKGTQTEISDHPLTQLLSRANPQDGFSAFMYKMVSYLVLTGNAFIEKIAPESGINKGIPLELHIHKPQHIKFLKNREGNLIGYELSCNGSTEKIWKLDPITMQSDLLQIKLFHPNNGFMGASPVEPTSREIDTSNEATEWNKKLLENEARPGMLFKFKNVLGDVQYARFKKELEAQQSGARNSGRNLILDGEADAIPYGWNMHDMDFLEGGREMARRIAMGFSVPPQIIGIIGDSTYKNYETAELSFWEKTIIWYLNHIKDDLNNWLFPDDQIFIDYELDDVPALAPRREILWKNINESTFLTLNEKREMLGFESIGTAGDFVFISSTLIPVGQEVVNTEDDLQNDEEIAIEKLVQSGLSLSQAEQFLGTRMN